MERDDEENTMLHCKVTEKLWMYFINLRGITWIMPRNTAEILACWNRGGNQSGHKERWKIVPAYIYWTLWRERVYCTQSYLAFLLEIVSKIKNL